MTFVGFAGIVLGLLAALWMSSSYTNRKIGFFALIASMHVVTAVIYYQYVQTNDADTKLYYFDPYGFYFLDFSLGTTFVVYFVQWMRVLMGGSYLDYFLLFQAFGLWGIALLIRTLEELAEVLGQHWPPIFTIMMFMPGMYFWTSAIGKDAPLFLACAMVLWSTMAISRRWVWFGLAIAIMVLFRLHVALVAVAALALTLMTGRGFSPTLRALLIVAIIPVLYVLVGTIQSSLKLDLASVGSVANYVELQTTTFATAAGDAEGLVTRAFPVRLISLLYLPIFIGAGGLFGFVASFQNVFMLYVSSVLVRESRSWSAMFRQSFPVRFATIFLIAMIAMLTVMYYNIGLGLRQREMFTPALYLVFGAVYLVRSARRAAELATADGINQTHWIETSR